MTCSNTETEIYLFKKIVENVEYLDNKNVKTTQMFKWASELRLAGSQYSPAAVRQSVNTTYRLLRKGQLPQLVQEDEELVKLGITALKKMGVVPFRPVVRFPKPSLNMENAAGTDDPKHRHYSMTEQEHLFIRLAERVDDVLGTKQQKNRFFNDMANELAEMGFIRNARSIQRWVSAIKEGRFPTVAARESLSWALAVVTKAFCPGALYPDYTDDDSNLAALDSEDDGDSPALRDDREIHPIRRYTSEDPSERADSPGSSDSGLGGQEQQLSDDTADTTRPTLRSILDQLQKTTAFEIISVKPMAHDGHSSLDKSSSLDDCPMEQVVNNVLENYKARKEELEAARKRKQAAENEALELKKKLRMINEEAFLEGQKIRLLEDQMGHMKNYIQANSTHP